MIPDELCWVSDSNEFFELNAPDLTVSPSFTRFRNQIFAHERFILINGFLFDVCQLIDEYTQM